MFCVSTQNPKTRAAIERLAQEENEPELNCRLASRMAFGTAGMLASYDEQGIRMRTVYTAMYMILGTKVS